MTVVQLACLVSSPPCAQESNPFPADAPEEHGISTEALAELTAVIEEWVDHDLIVGGELLVIKNRRTLLHESFGWRDREAETPLGRDTIYNIRSMTKVTTGAAIQILADRGALSLDDPVEKHLAGFDNDKSRAVTIGQLLTHRGGLPLSVYNLFKPPGDLIALADEAGKRGPYFEPEEKFWYSDAGADVLGAVVQQVAGEPLDVFVRREILEPLGMSDSFWIHEGRDPSRVANLYAGRPGDWLRYWGPGEESIYKYAWGSQSLFSTTRDYARFLAMYLDGGTVGERRVLSAAAVARTLTPVSVMNGLGSDEPTPTGFRGLVPHYGQMMTLHVRDEEDVAPRVEILGHSGSDGTNAWAWPKHDLIILFFTQSRGGPAAILIESWLEARLLPPVSRGDSPEPFAPYLGVWVPEAKPDESPRFTLFVQNERLTLHMDGDPFSFELDPPDEDGVWRSWLVPYLGVSFALAEDGVADTMVLHEKDELTPLRRASPPR